MIAYYRERIERVSEKIESLRRKDSFFNTARLGAFIALVLAAIFGGTTGNIYLLILTFLLLIAFVQLVLQHLKNHDLLTTQRNRKEMLLNEISSLEHKDNLYYNGSYFSDPSHDYASDMDLYGKGSLFQYINRSALGVGNRALARWLSATSPLPDILERQQAVKELSGYKEWCEELRVKLFPRRITDYDKEHLPEITRTIDTPQNLKTWIAISYSILFISAALVILAGLPAILLLLPVMFNIVLNSKLGTFTRTIRLQLEGRERTLNDYHFLLKAFENKNFTSSCLIKQQKELVTHHSSATHAIANLQDLSRKLDYSLNMIVGAILNLVFIWDILICRKITKWFNEFAPHTAVWFDVAGRLEALISLSNLHNNHPGWCYPEYTSGEFHLSGSELGHPLIPENERVCNSYSISQPTLLHIVTGSNMAGKSTFLRTIGVNIILASAGAPVCAQRLTLSHFRIMTYLTITDSLAENTSTFYREIKRLKKILDSARQDNNVLLLLDELLRGTNSADKARGSMAIARELINYNVPSIIATHNLELAAMHQQYPEQTANYYFDIIIDEQKQMRFDYKLKEGVCNTFNASLLLKEIGIDIEKS